MGVIENDRSQLIPDNDLLDVKFRPFSNENPFRINPMYSSMLSTEGMTNENFFDIKRNTNNSKVSPSGGNAFADLMVNSNSAYSKGKSFNAQINLVRRRIKVINSSKQKMRDKVARILSAERVPTNESPRSYFKRVTMRKVMTTKNKRY